MISSIFSNPIYVNPQGYAVIPELSTNSNIPIKDQTYYTKILTDGVIHMETNNPQFTMTQVKDKLQFYIPKVNKPIIFSLCISIDQGHGMLGQWILDTSKIDSDVLLNNLELEDGYNILYENNDLILTE